MGRMKEYYQDQMEALALGEEDYDAMLEVAEEERLEAAYEELKAFLERNYNLDMEAHMEADKNREIVKQILKIA